MAQPGPEDPGEDLAGSEETRPRAAFRQEAEHLVLTNPNLSLAFSITANGALVSFRYRPTQMEFIDSDYVEARGFFWRLQLIARDSQPITLTSRDATEFTHSVGYQGRQEGIRLWLQWQGFHSGAAPVEGKVIAQITLPADSSHVLLDLQVQLPSQLAVAWVEFPCVCALGSQDLLAEEALFLPLSEGLLIPEPRGALYAMGEPRRWQAQYPGPTSMQFLGYTCDRTTAWLSSRDISGARKTFFAAGLSETNRLAIGITHFPARQDHDLWSLGYSNAMGLLTGDWFEVAREYRAWASQQPWCYKGKGGERAPPILTSSYGVWTSHWGGTKRAVAAARELQRLVNVPVKLDWRCWHQCLRDGNYPDYLPPRDGEEAFARAKAQLAEASSLCLLSLNGLFVSRESETWERENAERFTVRQSATVSAESSALSNLVTMCPSTQYWSKKVASLAGGIADRGAEGVYLEDIAFSEPLVCHTTNHGHAGSTNQWSAGVRTLLIEVRSAIGENVDLVVDGPLESYLDLATAFISTHAAVERGGAFAKGYGSSWSPIPLFSSVYHDYSARIGPGASLVNYRPYDPLISAAITSEIRSPAALMLHNFQPQFLLEIGRALIWGHQLFLENFAPEQAREDTAKRKLAFMAAALRAQAWGVGALLPFSEFLGPLQIECAPVEVEFLINPPRSQATDRRVIHRRICPVLGSAWRMPGGGLALVIVNTYDQPVEFATRLRSSRLGMNLPLQFIGRTFSEDGDVPAASLRASGSEIAGRLPHRCVVLISLR